MIITDTKKAMMSILSKRHPDGSESVSPMKPQLSMEEDGEPDGKHAAAEDMIAAMHEKDAHKFAEAWANMHALHVMSEPEIPEQPDKES